MKYRYSIIKINSRQISDGTNSHYDALIRLWNDNLSYQSRERFTWFRDGNPNGHAASWLAFSETNDEPVGTGTFLPRKFIINGREMTAAIAVNFAVDKRHRVFGPALQLQKTMKIQSRDCGFDFIICFPNNPSKGVFLRLGYKVLGEVEQRVKLLRTESKFLNMLKYKPVASFVGIIVDSLFLIVDGMNYILNKGYNFRSDVIKKCDNRFDELWLSAKKSYSITGEKTSAYLNWRYTADPHGHNRYFCLFCKKTDTLQGYIVYSIRENVAYIQEMCAEEERHVRECLFLLFAMKLRKLNINSISMTYLSDKMFNRLLKRVNFILRPFKRQCFIYFNDDSHLKDDKSIMNKNNWFLSDGELDL